MFQNQTSGAVPALLYSPFPPEAYSRRCSECGRVGVGQELRAPHRRAWWNLYWLSDAAVDNLLAGEAEWGRLPLINISMLESCARAARSVIGGRPLSELLTTLTPTEFLLALGKGPYKRLAPYRVAGEGWMRTMRERAGLFRGLEREDANVSYVQFGRRPGLQKDETNGVTSATIMTLTSRTT